MPYLYKACVLKNLIWVSNQLQLLHNGHRFIQVQDNSSGCNAEIYLRKVRQIQRNKRKETVAALKQEYNWLKLLLHNVYC